MQHLEVSGSPAILPNKHRRLLTKFAMAGVPLVTAAVFVFAAASSRSSSKLNQQQQLAYCSAMTTSTITSLNTGNIRTKQTVADIYFRQHKELPRPSKVHATLPDLASSNHRILNSSAISVDSIDCTPTTIEGKNILVIGDVHGCYDELLSLHKKAVQENGGPFSHVILVGDLCNKGPYSAKVIRHVRLTPHWYSVRGNHDDGALSAALGSKDHLKKAKYAWIKEGDELTDDDDGNTDKVVLSDEDIIWLAELPYTITIPRDLTGDDEDTIIVHAGFIPEKDLLEQDIDDMITIRDVRVKCNDNGTFKHYKPHEKGKTSSIVASSPEEAKQCDSRVTWASAWFGPQRVVFGHNAKRRLQMYPGHWAIGLDTGAVYGGELTGMILPGRKLVSIETNDYSPVASEDG
jgi:hypothetical protein